MSQTCNGRRYIYRRERITTVETIISQTCHICRNDDRCNIFAVLKALITKRYDGIIHSVYRHLFGHYDVAGIVVATKVAVTSSVLMRYFSPSMVSKPEAQVTVQKRHKAKRVKRIFFIILKDFAMHQS